MFIKLTNGIPETYTIGQLRRDNPQTSFPKDIPTDMLAAYDVYPVKRVPVPDHSRLTQTVKAGSPVEIGGEWVQQWDVLELPLEKAEANVRGKRSSLLAQSDWVVPFYLEKGQPVPQEWQDYRQALRDIPQQEGFPYAVIWPTKPE